VILCLKIAKFITGSRTVASMRSPSRAIILCCQSCEPTTPGHNRADAKSIRAAHRTRGTDMPDLAQQPSQDCGSPHFNRELGSAVALAQPPNASERMGRGHSPLLPSAILSRKQTRQNRPAFPVPSSEMLGDQSA
jgi:hypothetical protein